MYKPTVELNVFDNYAVHILITRNTESGDPDVKKIGEKSQNKNGFIIHNAISNERRNKIIGMIEEIEPLIPRKLDDGIWIIC